MSEDNGHQSQPDHVHDSGSLKPSQHDGTRDDDAVEATERRQSNRERASVADDRERDGAMQDVEDAASTGNREDDFEQSQR